MLQKKRRLRRNIPSVLGRMKLVGRRKRKSCLSYPHGVVLGWLCNLDARMNSRHSRTD